MQVYSTEYRIAHAMQNGASKSEPAYHPIRDLPVGDNTAEAKSEQPIAVTGEETIGEEARLFKLASRSISRRTDARDDSSASPKACLPRGKEVEMKCGCVG